MRSRSFLLGALIAATFTALCMEVLSARADHARPQVIAVDRDAMLTAISRTSAELDETARLVASGDKASRKKALRRLRMLQANLDQLSSEIENAPALRGDGSAWIDPSDQDPCDTDPYAQPQQAPPQAYDDEDHRPGFGTIHAMSNDDFNRFVATVARASYASDKLALVQSQAPYAYFTAQQVGAVMDQLAYASDKIEAAAALWPRITDRQNAYPVYDHLAYSADRDTLRQRVGQ